MEVEPGDTYIVNGGEGYDLHGNNWLYQIHKFALWNYDHWEFIQPLFGELIIINNKYDSTDVDQNRVLVFNGKYWMEPIFKIPLQIELKVVRDKTVTQTSQASVDSIKTALINYYTPKFGLDINIDRSEISKIARSVSGGLYVEVVKPEIDLRFDYNISEDFDYEQLIEYTPELVMFTKNSITIRVYEQ